MSEDCPGRRPVTHTTGQRCAIHLWFHLEDVSHRLSITKPIFTILYSNRLSEAACMTKLPELYYYFHFFFLLAATGFETEPVKWRLAQGCRVWLGLKLSFPKWQGADLPDWQWAIGHIRWQMGTGTELAGCYMRQNAFGHRFWRFSLSPSIPLSLSFFIHIFIAHHSRTGAAKTLQNKVKFKEPPSNSTVFNCKHPISGQKG